MKKIISGITKKVFGQKPEAIKQILGKGVVNLVYKISVRGKDYILRFQKGKSALSNYQKEKWCMDAALTRGVPTAKCVSIGFHNGHGFSIQTFIEGRHGEEAKDQNAVWYALGKHAKKINSVKVRGYGEEFNFPGSSDDFYNWKGINDWSEDYFFADSFFPKYKIFTKDKLDRIRARLSQMRKWIFQPTLSHANLTPRNAIIHPGGDVYIVDWGTASGHLSPHRDVAELLAWDTKDKHFRMFLKGYGITQKQFKKIKHDCETIMIARLLSVIRWGIENKKNWRKEDFIRYAIRKLRKLDV